MIFRVSSLDLCLNKLGSTFVFPSPENPEPEPTVQPETQPEIQPETQPEINQEAKPEEEHPTKNMKEDE